MEQGKYYYSKKLSSDFDSAIEKVTNLLSEQGFGIITEVNVQETLKKKLDIDFKKYKILGACNPGYAHKALSIEDKVGTMLPCNVIVQELEPGTVEVAAVNPKASMMSIENNDLLGIANEVEDKLKTVINSL